MKHKIQIERNLVFGETDREYLTADVYRPCEGEELPAVILIHGGGFESGSKEKYREWGVYLAEAGFVAMAINYRLATDSYSTWPGILDDVKAAVHWLVSKANEWKIEPLKMGLIGDSAGATLSMYFPLANPANASFKIKAAIGVYGVYDLEHYSKNMQIPNGLDKKLMGATFSEAIQEYRNASAINHIDHALSHAIFDTRFFVIWGGQDPLVPPEQSKNFADKLKAARIETEELFIPDKGHFWFSKIPGMEGGGLQDYPNTEVAPRILEFLKEKLCDPAVGNFSPSLVKKLKTLK